MSLYRRLAIGNAKEAVAGRKFCFLAWILGLTLYYLMKAMQDPAMAGSTSSEDVMLLLGVSMVHAIKSDDCRIKKQAGTYLLLGMDRQSVLRIYVYETAIVVLGVLFLSLGLGICLTSLVIFFEGRACTMLSEELGSVFFFAALEREVFLIFIIAVIEILWKGRKLAGINLADLL